ERPTFRVDDERDLEDLLRAFLPLQFDGVLLETRTPKYGLRTRTDFLLESGAIALAAKHVSSDLTERRLAEQFNEDVAYYERRSGCRTLVSFVYDPEERLRDRRLLEVEWSKSKDELELRCVVAG